MKKNFSEFLAVIVILAVFVGASPFVLKAAIENKNRNAGFDEETPIAEVTPEVTDMPEPTTQPTEGPTDQPTASNEPTVSDEPTASAEVPTAAPTALPTATPKPVTPAPTVKSGDLPARAGEHGDFVTGDASYFDDALFIGDSRTVGICAYGTLKNADYFSTKGMSVFNINTRKSDYNATDMLFPEFIKAKKYKKVYISLGFNEVGYPKASIQKKYQELIDQIRAAQGEDVIIYLQANLLVTAKCSETDKYSHNPDLIEVNNRIAALADGQKTVYIDVNNIFCLPDGTLDPAKTGDGTHVYAKYYADWCEWLKTRIVRGTI